MKTTHIEVVSGGVGIEADDTARRPCGLGDGVDPVLEGDLQLATVLVREQNEAQNTRILYVKGQIFAGGKVHSRQGIVGALAP